MRINEKKSNDISQKMWTVVLFGASGSGKSTITFYLSHGYPPPATLKPTIAFGMAHVIIDTTILSLIDIGGQKKFLDFQFHENFLKTSDGLVLVLDATKDQYTYDEEWLLEADQNAAPNVPLLVLANKQDLPHALSAKFFEKNLLSHIKRPYAVFETVAYDPAGIRSGENIDNAFRWLIQKMEEASAHNSILSNKYFYDGRS